MKEHMTRTTQTPLAETIARVTVLDDYLYTDVGDLEAGWVRADELMRADAPHLDQGLALSVARYPGAEQRVAGAFFIGHYVWYLTAAAIGSYLAERRVPDLARTNVALRYGMFAWEEDGESGESERIDVRFLSGRFAALPDDPAADHPDALIMPDEAALREWLRLTIEAHIEPLVEAIAACTRLGRRAQWNLAADSCASLFSYAGQHLQAAERARAEGLTFIKAPGSPMRASHTSFTTLEWNGHQDTFVERGGCCLYYRVAEGHNCLTCPLQPEEARKQRLLTYMESRQASQEAA
jgi:hypothetical protein